MTDEVVCPVQVPSLYKIIATRIKLMADNRRSDSLTTSSAMNRSISTGNLDKDGCSSESFAPVLHQKFQEAFCFLTSLGCGFSAIWIAWGSKIKQLSCCLHSTGTLALIFSLWENPVRDFNHCTYVGLLFWKIILQLELFLIKSINRHM